MKTVFCNFPILSSRILFLFLLAILPSASHAHDHSDDKMSHKAKVTDAWARATFALAKTGAAYMEIENTSDSSVRLISVSVSDDVASTAELHHTKMVNDMMQMQQLEDGVLLAAGEKDSFVPGGKHIMLMGLSGPLNEGESVDITLNFADGSSKTHSFKILDKRIASDALHKHH